MPITDMTNTNTTVGSVTRIIELGVEAIGFGILCGVKKDTKEIRSKENEILAAARNLESDNKVLLSNSKYVADWVKDTKKSGIPIQLTQQDINVAVKSALDQANPTSDQAPTPAPQQTFTLEQVKELLDKQAAQQQAPNITTIVTGDAKQPKAPTQQETAAQTPAQQAAPVDLNELMDKLNGLTTTVNQLVANSQNNNTDANKGKGGK